MARVAPRPADDDFMIGYMDYYLRKNIVNATTQIKASWSADPRAWAIAAGLTEKGVNSFFQSPPPRTDIDCYAATSIITSGKR